MRVSPNVAGHAFGSPHKAFLIYIPVRMRNIFWRLEIRLKPKSKKKTEAGSVSTPLLV